MTIKERIRKWFDTPRSRRRKKLEEIVEGGFTDEQKLWRRWHNEPTFNPWAFILIPVLIIGLFSVYLSISNALLISYHIENIHHDNYDAALEEQLEPVGFLLDMVLVLSFLLFGAVGVNVFGIWWYYRKTKKMEEELLAKRANEAVK